MSTKITVAAFLVLLPCSILSMALIAFCGIIGLFLLAMGIFLIPFVILYEYIRDVIDGLKFKRQLYAPKVVIKR